MRGRDLIRQLTQDSQSIPKRGRVTLDTLKDKIEEISLLIELNDDHKSFQEVKDEIIKYIAQLDLSITDLQDKIAHLNKVAEVLLNLNNAYPESRRLARYDYAKMNLTASVKLEQVEQEIEISQENFEELIAQYEDEVRRLEKFVESFSRSGLKRDQSVNKTTRELE